MREEEDGGGGSLPLRPHFVAAYPLCGGHPRNAPGPGDATPPERSAEARTLKARTVFPQIRRETKAGTSYFLFLIFYFIYCGV
jgi:hypothetical protein